jgi:predicted nucleic acid-binding protein
MSITYFDTSALVKLYIQEAHSEEVISLVNASEGIGTSFLTYTEMAAAMSRAARMQLIPYEAARNAWERYVGDWPSITRLKISTALVERAAALAWRYGMRGYDAMQLASALIWQEGLGEAVLLATFDRLVWSSGKKAGIAVWPEALVAE